MQPFDYEAPETVDAALAALAEPPARALVGGTDLIAQMREGRRQVGRVVDLKRIEELVAIRENPDGGVTVGAAASATAVARQGRIAQDYPALAAAAKLIGSRQIQNRASLGGNLCNAAPSADSAPILMCLGAQVEIAGPDGRYHIAVSELFAGPGLTVLLDHEVLVGITLPPPAPRSAARYLRFTPRREMDIAVAGVATSITLGENGRIAQGRVALASVAPTPIFAPDAAAALMGEAPDVDAFVAAAAAAAANATPITDTRGSADYRRDLVAVLTRRALADCAGQLGVGEMIR